MDRNLPCIFNNGVMDFFDARDSSRSQSGVEFMMRQFLPFHNVGREFAVVNEYLGPTLNDSFQGFALISQTTYNAVCHYERRSGHNSARNGIIAPVHGVLHRITQNQQQDQIEGRQLTHLSFTGHPQNDQKEGINNEPAENELPPGKSSVPHEGILVPRP